jgi:hypothetical protein
MLDFLIDITQYFLYILTGLFLLVFISFFALAKTKKFYIVLIGFGLLVITAISMILIGEAIEDILRDKIKDKTAYALSNESTVFIDGEDLGDHTQDLLKDLSKINGAYFSNKSSPDERFSISIIVQNDTLDIFLRRDINNNQKYWVYIPNIDYGKELDIIKSEALDDF